MRGVRPYRDRSDAELLQFLEDCARQTWSLEERRIFEQLMRRLRLVMERVPEGDALAAAGGGVPEEGATHADQHLIQFTDSGWTIAHPLSERIDLDSLFDCPMRWEHADPGVRGVFVLDFDGTLGDEVRRVPEEGSE